MNTNNQIVALPVVLVIQTTLGSKAEGLRLLPEIYIVLYGFQISVLLIKSDDRVSEVFIALDELS